MLGLIKNFFKRFISFIDPFLIIPLLISTPAFYIFARIGGKRLKFSRKLLKKFGIYPIRDHYYSPLFKDINLKKSLREPRYLPGINLSEGKQLNFLENLTFNHELSNLEDVDSDDLSFNFANGNFESGDAEFLYQIVRFLKPQTIIEIGSGNSTKIVNKALKKNYSDNSIKCKHICIEPYEMRWLESLGVDVIRKPLQECDLKLFNCLNRNDLLFIDSSHIIRPQGDVLKEYLEIIPLLKSGVFVHVHDIFTPRDYLDEWIREDVLFWNEQYLLECLLSNKGRYEVIAALNFLKHTNFYELKKVCPYLKKEREPGSFYFKIRDKVFS